MNPQIEVNQNDIFREKGFARSAKNFFERNARTAIPSGTFFARGN